MKTDKLEVSVEDPLVVVVSLEYPVFTLVIAGKRNRLKRNFALTLLLQLQLLFGEHAKNLRGIIVNLVARPHHQCIVGCKQTWLLVKQRHKFNGDSKWGFKCGLRRWVTS